MKLSSILIRRSYSDLVRSKNNTGTLNAVVDPNYYPVPPVNAIPVNIPMNIVP